MPPENDDQDQGAVDAGVGFTPEQQAHVNRLVGAARRSGREAERKEAEAAAAQKSQMDAAIASAVDARLAQMGIAPASKPPAAAPSAPSKVDPLTNAGLVDIWNLSDAQMMQLGPAGMRDHYEKILSHAQSASGAPRRPEPKKK